MEFSLRKEGSVVVIDFTIADGVTKSEIAPLEACKTRELLFTYATRRLQALASEHERKGPGLPYNELDKDLNKVFKVEPAGQVAEKATNKVVDLNGSRNSK